MTKLRQKLSPVHFISRASNKVPPVSTHSHLPRNKTSGSLKKMGNRLCCLKEADVLFGHLFQSLHGIVDIRTISCILCVLVTTVPVVSSSRLLFQFFRLIHIGQTNHF